MTYCIFIESYFLNIDISLKNNKRIYYEFAPLLRGLDSYKVLEKIQQQCGFKSNTLFAVVHIPYHKTLNFLYRIILIYLKYYYHKCNSTFFGIAP